MSMWNNYINLIPSHVRYDMTWLGNPPTKYPYNNAQSANWCRANPREGRLHLVCPYSVFRAQLDRRRRRSLLSFVRVLYIIFIEQLSEQPLNHFTQHRYITSPYEQRQSSAVSLFYTSSSSLIKPTSKLVVPSRSSSSSSSTEATRVGNKICMHVKFTFRELLQCSRCLLSFPPSVVWVTHWQTPSRWLVISYHQTWKTTWNEWLCWRRQ